MKNRGPKEVTGGPRGRATLRTRCPYFSSFQDLSIFSALTKKGGEVRRTPCYTAEGAVLLLGLPWKVLRKHYFPRAWCHQGGSGVFQKEFYGASHLTTSQKTKMGVVWGGGDVAGEEEETLGQASCKMTDIQNGAMWHQDSSLESLECLSFSKALQLHPFGSPAPFVFGLMILLFFLPYI